MKLTLRPFTDDDYEPLAEVRRVISPEYPVTAAEIRRRDAKGNPEHVRVRWVGNLDGQPVAFGLYMHHSSMHHPSKFSVGVTVHPDYQQRGFGSHMYNHLLSELQLHDPHMLRVNIREDEARSMRFAHDRNFREEMRDWESRLDVTSFDFAPYADYDEYVRNQGIAIKTLGELTATDPAYARKLYELDTALFADVPMPEPFTPMPYEDWVRHTLDNPGLLADAYFVAVDGDDYVGMSALWKHEGWDDLDTGLTGVRREYRRKSIALALKLRAIAYAREQGVATIRTDNEANNRAMLAINERLGFVKQPAWISLVNVLEEEERE